MFVGFPGCDATAWRSSDETLLQKVGFVTVPDLEQEFSPNEVRAGPDMKPIGQ